MPDRHEYQIHRVGDRWVLTVGEITVTAETVVTKKDTVLLTVDSGLTNLFGAWVKLTDLPGRKRVVKELKPHSVPITEPMLRALDRAIRENPNRDGIGSGDNGKRKALMLDDAPHVLNRPLCIIDERAYVASWVYLDTGPSAELVIIRDDGVMFSDTDIQDALPVGDIGITVQLPNAISRKHCWSGRGIQAYRNGYRADAATVFHELVRLTDHFVRFVRSLGEQHVMCELIACYNLHIWALEAFSVAGYLWAGGEKGSGKSQLLKFLCKIGFVGQELTAGATLPVLRDLSDLGALLGLDDAEQIADPKAFDADKAALLLSGNRRGATIPIKEPAPNGKGWVTREVNIFGPRVFSAIGAPPHALATRCINVPMCKAVANVADPADETRWPVQRREVIDNLWALSLASIRQVRECDRELDKHTELIGRALEPWRGVLGVALWLDRCAGVTGLFDRMTRLSQSYQREREELELEDPTRLAVRCLGDMLSDHAEDTPLVFKTAELTDRMNTLGKEIDAIEEGRELKPPRVGRLLGRLRLKKPPNMPGKRRWLITRDFYDALALAYGVQMTNTPAALPVAALAGALTGDDGEEF